MPKDIATIASEDIFPNDKDNATIAAQDIANIVNADDSTPIAAEDNSSNASRDIATIASVDNA